MQKFLLLASVLVCTIGCKTGVYPDPNEPRRGSVVSADTLQANLASISDSLLQKRVKGYITTSEYKDLLAKAADELVSDLDLENVAPADAWRYAEILRAGRNWKAAERMLQVAVKAARAGDSQDRRVNDTLRWAEVLGQVGKVDEALKEANMVMDARPVDSAPILPAVLYEIAPVLKGHERDAEVAKLLEDAADKHMNTTVDGGTQAGRDFLMARPYHVHRALGVAAELYNSSGKAADRDRVLRELREAREDFDAFMRDRQGVSPIQA